MSQMPSLDMPAVSLEEDNNNEEEEEVVIEVIECEEPEEYQTDEEPARCLLCGATVAGGNRMPVDDAHRAVCLERLALVDDTHWASIKLPSARFAEDVYFCPTHYFQKGSIVDSLRRHIFSFPRPPSYALEAEVAELGISSSLARFVNMPIARLVYLMLVRGFDEQTRRRVMEIRWMGEEAMKEQRVRQGRSGMDGFVSRPKGILNMDQEELQCPNCDFRSRAVRAWTYHLRAVHSTNPRKLGIALLCECGNESFTDGHSRKCAIAKVTLISRSAGPQCMMCEIHPKTASGFAHHLTYHHKTSLRMLRMFIKCSCGHRITSHTTDPGHTKRCGGYEFTLHKIVDKPDGSREEVVVVPPKKKTPPPAALPMKNAGGRRPKTCILDDDYKTYTDEMRRTRKEHAQQTVTMDDVEAVEQTEAEMGSKSADQVPVKSAQPDDLQVEFIGTIDDSVIVSIDRNGVECRVKVEKQGGRSKRDHPAEATSLPLTGREMKRSEELPEFFVVKRPRPDAAEPAEPVETVETVETTMAQPPEEENEAVVEAAPASTSEVLQLQQQQQPPFVLLAYPDSFQGDKMCNNHVVMHDYGGEEQKGV